MVSVITNTTHLFFKFLTHLFKNIYEMKHYFRNVKTLILTMKGKQQISTFNT